TVSSRGTCCVTTAWICIPTRRWASAEILTTSLLWAPPLLLLSVVSEVVASLAEVDEDAAWTWSWLLLGLFLEQPARARHRRRREREFLWGIMVVLGRRGPAPRALLEG